MSKNKAHVYKRNCDGIELEFHVTEMETNCAITAVMHKGVDIRVLMDDEFLRAAQIEFYHKLINHAV